MGSCICKEKRVSSPTNRNRGVVTVQRHENVDSDHCARAPDMKASEDQKTVDHSHGMIVEKDKNMHVKDNSQLDGQVRIPISSAGPVGRAHMDRPSSPRPSQIAQQNDRFELIYTCEFVKIRH